MAGIVYYANYLRDIEWARSDWVREIGIDHKAMREDGQMFAVRRVEADYLTPAQFDDELTVTTSIKHVTGARLVLEQLATRDSEVLFKAEVTIVYIGEGGAPARLPADFRRLMN